MRLLSSVVRVPSERHVDIYDPDGLIAERRLKRCDTGADVFVRVFRPVPDPEDPQHTWVCGFEITGLDETIRSSGHGVDSMQALMVVFLGGIGHYLKKMGLPLAWLSETPGWIGFERFHTDPDMDALFEHLMEAEMIRQSTVFRLLDPSSRREPATDLLLEHTKEAEAIRQKILRRILEQATKRRG